MMDQLGMTSIRDGSNGTNPNATNAANYTEEKANPYPRLPDALILKNGQPVTSADTWWNQRPPRSSRTWTAKFMGVIPRTWPTRR